MDRIVGGVVVLCALAAGGCGTADDAAEVRSVAERFYGAIRADDGGRACEMLSAGAREQLEGQSGQECDGVVTRLQYAGGRIEAVDVFVTNAKVDLSSG